MKDNFVLLGNAPIKLSDFSVYFEIHVGALRAQGPRQRFEFVTAVTAATAPDSAPAVDF